jgi:hypothetical protein
MTNLIQFKEIADKLAEQLRENTILINNLNDMYHARMLAPSSNREGFDIKEPEWLKEELDKDKIITTKELIDQQQEFHLYAQHALGPILSDQCSVERKEIGKASIQSQELIELVIKNTVDSISRKKEEEEESNRFVVIKDIIESDRLKDSMIAVMMHPSSNHNGFKITNIPKAKEL